MATKNDTHIAYSAVIAQFAERNDTDTTRAGKALRSRIRALGTEKVASLWPEFKASGKACRDGNRYPTSMPKTFADVLLAPRVTINNDAEAAVTA